MTTRDRIIEDLKRATIDTIRTFKQPAPACSCDDCRIARAQDITPNPRVFQITPAQYQRLIELSEGLGWSTGQLNDFSARMFQKAPALLREIEAGAIIGHLERGDI